MREVPKGERKCEECQYCHPERKDRPCSALGQMENEDGECAMYLYCDPRERVVWR